MGLVELVGFVTKNIVLFAPRVMAPVLAMVPLILVTTAAYQVEDGGLLDQDHLADSNIVDPVGLAQGVVGVPNTGIK